MDIGRDTVQGAGFRLVPAPTLLVLNATTNFLVNPQKTMFGIMFRIQINKQTLIPYNVFTLRDNDLAIKITGRFNVPGAENLYTVEFERLETGKEVLAVVKLVVSSDTSLRTPATIVRFQQIPAEPNSPQPIFQYFSTLLETGSSLIEWLKDDRFNSVRNLVN